MNDVREFASGSDSEPVAVPTAQRRSGLHQNAVNAIAGWIVGGRVKAGEVIPNEANIGIELGVSRTVVREAVRTLVAKGMLRTKRRLGTEVRPVSEWSVFDPDVMAWRLARAHKSGLWRDIYELRLGIETLSAVKCATDPAFDVAGLNHIFAELEQLVLEGAPEAADADVAFHRCLIEGTGNQFFSHFVPLFGTFIHAVAPQVFGTSRAAPIIEIHRAITDAVTARDPQATRAAMERHFNEALRNFQLVPRPAPDARLASRR